MPITKRQAHYGSSKQLEDNVDEKIIFLKI